MSVTLASNTDVLTLVNQLEEDLRAAHNGHAKTLVEFGKLKLELAALRAHAEPDEAEVEAAWLEFCSHEVPGYAAMRAALKAAVKARASRE